jgi:hypothetical protein
MKEIEWLPLCLILIYPHLQFTSCLSAVFFSHSMNIYKLNIYLTMDF